MAQVGESRVSRCVAARETQLQWAHMREIWEAPVRLVYLAGMHGQCFHSKCVCRTRRPGSKFCRFVLRMLGSTSTHTHIHMYRVHTYHDPWMLRVFSFFFCPTYVYVCVCTSVSSEDGARSCSSHHDSGCDSQHLRLYTHTHQCHSQNSNDFSRHAVAAWSWRVLHGWCAHRYPHADMYAHTAEFRKDVTTCS